MREAGGSADDAGPCAQATEGTPERPAEANLAKDGRIVLKAPPRDGEVRKPALAIDAALAGAPFARRAGRN